MPKVLLAPKQPDAILDIARALTPPGFELVFGDPGTPEFYQVAPEIEYFLGFARRMGGEFFPSPFEYFQMCHGFCPLQD